MKRQKKTLLEKQIEIIAKKLNIFTLADLEVLVEKPRIDILSVLESQLSKNFLKQDGNSYIFVPKTVKSVKKEYVKDNREFSLIHCLLFQPKKPKEVYLRNINELDGFVDYFFSTKATKNKIKRILKILKDSHGLKGYKLRECLRENRISIETYNKYKNEIAKNGLINLVGNSTQEPGEIFYFFKEYYLSPKKLTIAEARELAIQRFEKLIKMRLNRGKITKASIMLRWLQQEYNSKQIEKFRNYNFLEFDTENMFHE